MMLSRPSSQQRLVAGIISASAAFGCAQPPRTDIDPIGLVVRVGEISVDLETTCGIEPSLQRRDFDVLTQRIGWDDWRMLIFLNQVPALEIFTDTGRFECGIASKAFGPAEKNPDPSEDR